MPQPPCVRRYIQNPLLLSGKKFDVRSYLLIACAAPYMVFFGHGYARLTLSLYDPHSSDLRGHLTNQVRGPRDEGALCSLGSQKGVQLWTRFDGERPLDAGPALGRWVHGWSAALGTMRVGLDPGRSRWARGHGGDGRRRSLTGGGTRAGRCVGNPWG